MRTALTPLSVQNPKLAATTVDHRDIRTGSAFGQLIIMTPGTPSLGSKTEPKYMPMRAEQILAAPRGFVRKLRAGESLMKLSGSDAAEDGDSWSRFWLLNVGVQGI